MKNSPALYDDRTSGPLAVCHKFSDLQVPFSRLHILSKSETIYPILPQILHCFHHIFICLTKTKHYGSFALGSRTSHCSRSTVSTLCANTFKPDMAMSEQNGWSLGQKDHRGQLMSEPHNADSSPIWPWLCSRAPLDPALVALC
ncbi:hypothetical protein BpHYR1_027346 [Brachionus plicatilis]|uniref:Uncharacterized protein n=1 Tax=Brachionus plicatilis TaxID=10195 RepID=A0A3M7PYH0_BRAPC|nr:hypothetical protein BpHYR1_027346 [Brachionus plicatilis]